MARAGLGSRRELEKWIADGRITVNGQLAKVGDRVGARDVISVDGRRLPASRVRVRPPRVIRYHKPVGEVCSRRDPQIAATVFERLPALQSGRWIAIGRLDVNTSGLLLFTDSGQLAHRLMHPSSGIEREYAVRVRGEVTREMLRDLCTGVTLEDGAAAFSSVTPAGGTGVNQWFHVVIGEGRRREVRRLWESQGVQVSRLIRVRFGAARLPRRLRAGHWEDLPARDLNALLESAGMR